MPALERELGLRHVESSAKSERRAVTKGEIEEGLRTGKPSTRQQLQQLSGAAANECRKFKHYSDAWKQAQEGPFRQADISELFCYLKVPGCLIAGTNHHRPDVPNIGCGRRPMT